MSSPLPLPPGFDELSVQEKIEYVQSLWDAIVSESESLPVPEWHRELLRERLAKHRADPDAARPWDEVLAELDAKYPQSR